MTTLTAFLLARIAEDEAVARAAQELDVTTWYTERRDVRGRQLLQGVSEDHPDFDEDVDVFTAATRNHATHIAHHNPARVLADCAARRRIVELHRDWPVLVEKPVEFEPSLGADLPFSDQVTYRASQQIAWMTEQEYRNRFGDEPPTGPIIRTLASVYADHPDYHQEWKV